MIKIAWTIPASHIGPLVGGAAGALVGGSVTNAINKTRLAKRVIPILDDIAKANIANEELGRSQFELEPYREFAAGTLESLGREKVDNMTLRDWILHSEKHMADRARRAASQYKTASILPTMAAAAGGAGLASLIVNAHNKRRKKELLENLDGAPRYSRDMEPYFNKGDLGPGRFRLALDMGKLSLPYLDPELERNINSREAPGFWSVAIPAAEAYNNVGYELDDDISNTKLKDLLPVYRRAFVRAGGVKNPNRETSFPTWSVE